MSTTETTPMPAPTPDNGDETARLKDELRAKDARLANMSDEAETKDAEIARLRYEKDHDPLTGLSRKGPLVEKAKEYRAKGITFALILVDLDKFKSVNDERGYPEGDRLLAGVGQTLRDNFREGDEFSHERLFDLPGEGTSVGSMSRAGGDEFLMLFELTPRSPHDTDLDDTQDMSPDDRGKLVLGRVREVFAPFIDGQDPEIKNLRFNASMGYAVYTPDAPVEVDQMITIAQAGVHEDKVAHGATDR